MEGPLLKNRYCSKNLYKKQKETISKINSEKKSNTQNYPPKTVQSNQRVEFSDCDFLLTHVFIYMIFELEYLY